MTTPPSSGGSSSLRVGGLALLGVGAVAGLIGVASLAGGGAAPSNTAAAPSSETIATSVETPSTPDGIAAPPTSAAPDAGAVPVPSFGPAPNGAAGASATAAAPAPATAAPAPAAPKVVRSPLRVYNNGTRTGLATKAAGDFRAQGWSVEKIDNYPQGVIPTTTVYFRPGTAEEASAKSLANAFGMRAEPRFQGLDDASPGLIVIVTNDYKG